MHALALGLLKGALLLGVLLKLQAQLVVLVQIKVFQQGGDKDVDENNCWTRIIPES